MLSLIFALVVGVAFAVVLAIGARRGRWGSPVEVAAGDSPAATIAIRGARQRMFGCYILFVVVAVVITTDPLGVQPAFWSGVGQSLGPGIAAAIALIPLVVSPLSRWSAPSGLRSAELKRRGGGSFGPRWGFVLPLASAALLAGFLIVAGLTSAPDEAGLMRSFTVSTGTASDSRLVVSNSASPYPGWFYGIPLLAVTILIAIVVVISLRRIASAPRPASASLYPLDDGLRQAGTRFVMLLSGAALLFYFAAVVFVAGRATANVGFAITTWNGDTLDLTSASQPNAIDTLLQPVYGIGVMETVLGVAFALIAIGLFAAAGAVAAVRWAPASALTPAASARA